MKKALDSFMVVGFYFLIVCLFFYCTLQLKARLEVDLRQMNASINAAMYTANVVFIIIAAAACWWPTKKFKAYLNREKPIDENEKAGHPLHK